MWGRFGDDFRCRFTRLGSTFIAKITGVVVSVFECGAVIVFKLEPPQPAVAAALLALAHARCSIGMMMAADFVVRVGEPLVPCPLHFFRRNETAPFAAALGYRKRSHSARIKNPGVLISFNSKHAIVCSSPRIESGRGRWCFGECQSVTFPVARSDWSAASNSAPSALK